MRATGCTRRALQVSAAALTGMILWTGCVTTGSTRNKAREAIDAGDFDQAVYLYSRALADDPRNLELRKSLEHAKVKASQFHQELGRSYLQSGALDLAIAELRMANNLDPTNRFVADTLENALADKREIDRRPEAKTALEQLKEDTRGSGAPAVLQPSSEAPLTLNFPPNTKVKDIYVALGKAAGINFLFDSGVRDQETFSIDIANISFRKALDQVAIANKHFYKVVDERTLMVIPDNPQKRRDYEDNVIKTFYLSNSLPNDVVNTLRALLDAKRLSVNPQLNAITIRDTPAKLSVMERIIAANDRPPSEVVIDIEIIEVQRGKTLEYGTGLTDYRINQVLEQSDEVNGVQGLRLSSLPYINASDWLLTFPGLIYRARKGEGSIRTIARPSLRALDGKQVTLRLGEQVPIETSTFSATTGGTVPLTRNFQFRDIGQNIDITPRVHHNNEVTLLLQIELTSIGDDPDGGAGPIPPTFGNRRINTEIRLKDGETNLLAGLFTSSEERGRVGLPILSDIPVLKHIFAENSSRSREVDIVLTLTPHIVRTPNIRPADLKAFYVGTEANVGGIGATGLEGVFGAGEKGGSAAPGGMAGTAPRPSSAVRSAGPVDLPGAAAAAPAGPEPAATPGPRTGAPQEPDQAPPRPGEGTPGAPSPGGGPSGAIGPGGSATPAPTPPPVLTPAIVAFSPASLTAAVGREVTVDVVVEGAVGVAHAPFYVTYDPAVLEFVNATEGSFLRADGKPTQFLASGGPGDGRVIVGLSRVGRVPGVDGRGVLATLRFRGKDKGTSPLVLQSLQLRDFQQKTLPANSMPGSIAIP